MSDGNARVGERVNFVDVRLSVGQAMLRKVFRVLLPVMLIKIPKPNGLVRFRRAGQLLPIQSS